MGYVFKRNSVWWIAYSNGKQMPYYKVIRESTRQSEKEEAIRQLKIREGDVANGVPIVTRANSIRVKELLADVIIDYRINGHRSIDILEVRIKNHLEPHLGGYKMVDLTAADIKMYTNERLKEGAANGTINRELSHLKRSFKLGIENGRIRSAPHIKMLRENNVRQGFFEAAEFETLCRYLPDHIEPLIRFLYLTGWRVSEGKQLKWKDIAWESKEIFLWQESSKNRHSRVFPLIPELEAMFLNLRKSQDNLCPNVFQKNGSPIGCFRASWKTACRKAGLVGRLVHDLRRSAVRNFVRAGISERVCMLLTGHRSRTIFDRYDIVSESDIEAAAKKMSTLPEKKEGMK